MQKVRGNLRKTFILVLFAIIFATPDLAHAETSSSSMISFDVGETISIVLGSESINFSSTDNELMSRNMTVTGSTNSAAGYTISLNTSNNYTDLKHTNPGVQAAIPTISEDTSAMNFPSNYWGYTEGLSTANSMPTSETIFKPIPLNPTNIFATAKNGDATHIFTTGIKTDSSLPAGLYSNELVFTIVAKIVLPTPPGTEGGSINDPGGGNSGQVYPANSLARAFELAYVSAGKPIYVSDSDAAIGWRPMVENEDITGRSVRFAIQDIDLTFTDGLVTHSVCEWAAQSTNALAIDLRDGTSYRVGKLKDNRCWILDNLVLNPTLPTVKTRMIGNTNGSDAAVNNFINGGGGQSGWSTGAVAYEGSSSVYNQPRIQTGSINSLPQGNDPLAAEVAAGGWKTGIYYNYCAATLGTYCYGENSGIDKNPNSAIDAEFDICPKGWRLPTGGPISSVGTNAGGGEWQLAYDAYETEGDSDAQYFAFRRAHQLPLGGYYSWGGAYQSGVSLSVWSSTFYDSNYAYYLTMFSNDSEGNVTRLQNANYRTGGRSVRCVAK